MSERFVSGVSAKIALYKYSSFPFLFPSPLTLLFLFRIPTMSTFDCQSSILHVRPNSCNVLCIASSSSCNNWRSALQRRNLLNCHVISAALSRYRKPCLSGAAERSLSDGVKDLVHAAGDDIAALTTSLVPLLSAVAQSSKDAYCTVRQRRSCRLGCPFQINACDVDFVHDNKCVFPQLLWFRLIQFPVNWNVGMRGESDRRLSFQVLSLFCEIFGVSCRGISNKLTLCHQSPDKVKLNVQNETKKKTKKVIKIKN